MNRRFFTKAVVGGSLGFAFSAVAAAASRHRDRGGRAGDVRIPGAFQGLITTRDAWAQMRIELSRDAESMKELREAAEAGLRVTRLSVVDKTTLPPSKDAHDFSSVAPYFWPDPAKVDGRPYIRKDGQVNPEYYKTDRPKLNSLCDTVTALTLCSLADGKPGPYAAHAGKLLRGWFLDAETRMNPNLNFAQAIAGRTTGRGDGIIDTTCCCYLLDAIGRLEMSSEWTGSHLAGLQEWFSQYLDWLLTSPQGKAECAAENNHGTWFDAQVAAYAIFCGRKEIARRHIETHVLARIKKQIRPDGSQPHELARTLSLSYSSFNLLAFTCLAQLAPHVDLDLWRWRDHSGCGVLTAIRFLIPYYLGEKKWTWPQIEEFRKPVATLLLNLAAQGIGAEDVQKAALAYGGKPWNRVSAFGASVRDDGPLKKGA